MILAIDIGNSHSVLALFSDEGRMVHHWRFATIVTRKIGGCLIEHHAPHVIVGVGINIASKPADDDVSWRASCLSEEGYHPFGKTWQCEHDGDDDDSCH